MGAFMSYEVQRYCYRNDRPLDCKTQFSGTTVTKIGGIERGNFEPDPDIAGIGVLLAFLVPESIALVFGFLIVFARTDYIWRLELGRPTLNAWFLRRSAAAHITNGSSDDLTMRASGENPDADTGSRAPRHPSGARPYSGSTMGNWSGLSSDYGNGGPSRYANGSETRLPSEPTHPRAPSPLTQQHGTAWQLWHKTPHRIALWIDTWIFSPFKPGAIKVTMIKEKRFGEKLYEFFEVALLAISDTQLLLGIAQVISFGLLGKCETSRYHYMIGTYMVLLACWSAFIAMVLVRCYWKAPLAAFIRTICFLVLALFLAALYDKQLRHEKTAPYKPLQDRKDSLVFLAGSCFLDADLWRETFDSLSQAQLEAVGWANPKTSPDFISYVVLCACAAFALPVLIIRFCRDLAGAEEGHTKRINNRFYQLFVTAYWVLPWVAGMAVYSYIFYTIFYLRSWVYASAWMNMPGGSNKENEVHGFGQIAPIVATCAVIIAVSDKWEKLPRINETRKDIEG